MSQLAEAVEMLPCQVGLPAKQRLCWAYLSSPVCVLPRQASFIRTLGPGPTDNRYSPSKDTASVMHYGDASHKKSNGSQYGQSSSKMRTLTLASNLASAAAASTFAAVLHMMIVGAWTRGYWVERSKTNWCRQPRSLQYDSLPSVEVNSGIEQRYKVFVSPRNDAIIPFFTPL